MKKIIPFLFIITLFFFSCTDEIAANFGPPKLDYGRYFCCADFPAIFEEEDYTIIAPRDTFFIYDKKQEKVIKAYGFNSEEVFAPNYRCLPKFDYKKEIIILEAENTEDIFRDYYFIYDIKHDKFTKKTGKFSDEISQRERDYSVYEEADNLHWEQEGGSEQMNKEDTELIETAKEQMTDETMRYLYYVSIYTGKKVYPFRNNFNRADFGVK